MKNVLKFIKIGGYVGINFPQFPVKKEVKFIKMSWISCEIGVILNFWNGHVLRLQIQGGHTREKCRSVNHCHVWWKTSCVFAAMRWVVEGCTHHWITALNHCGSCIATPSTMPDLFTFDLLWKSPILDHAHSSVVWWNQENNSAKYSVLFPSTYRWMGVVWGMSFLSKYMQRRLKLTEVTVVYWSYIIFCYYYVKLVT